MLAKQHPWKSPWGPCFSAAFNQSQANVELLEEQISRLSNASVGALRLSLHGFEAQALQLLQAQFPPIL